MPTFDVTTSTGQTVRVHAATEAEAKRHVDVLAIRNDKVAGVAVTGTPVLAIVVKE